jgi:hypothetical protein
MIHHPMNITININVVFQQPEPEVIVRIPATLKPKPVILTKAETDSQYLSHRLRIYNKIKRVFGIEAANLYLAGAI